MYSYATRGLGFLVRCATISRQLGQGRQRSGGSPLFMINHRSSYVCLFVCVTYGCGVVLIVCSVVGGGGSKEERRETMCLHVCYLYPTRQNNLSEE